MILGISDFENLRLAFTRVEASHGMPGVDGVSIAAFKHKLDENLYNLSSELREGRYAPLPLLRFLVAKLDGSPRALCVPAIRDRVAQAAVLNVVGPIFEGQFEDASFAYRKGRSVKQAAWRIKELRERGYRYLVQTDIDSFFDNVDHELLLAKVGRVICDPHVLRLIGLWVKAEVYDGEKIYILEKGICQGLVVSPMLANLFLDELDEALLSRGYQLVRYSDDFIVLAKSRSGAEKALECTEEILNHMHLALDPEDTLVTDFDKGFKYLGLVFQGCSIFAPFDRPAKERRILYMPPPFDLARYLAAKRAWQKGA
jgi:group II intron reverse transcriptase/maturase